MIDTLRHNLSQAVPGRQTLIQHGAGNCIDAGFAILTLHRPSNVDDGAILKGLLGAIRDVSRLIPVVIPMHPRTRTKIEQHGLHSFLDAERIAILPPVGYLEMLGLMQAARLVLTDSGGIQEETTALGVPCLTLRENTERPITEQEGTNTIVGTQPARILAMAQEIVNGGGKAGRIPELWDGHASERIVAVLRKWLHTDATRKIA